MQLEVRSENFLPHQFKFLQSQAKIIALVSGFGAGKTYCFLRKTLIHHIYNRRADGISNGWIIYPTLDLANELFVDDFKLLLEDLEIEYDWNVSKNRFKTAYGNIRIYTLEQPNRMVGANLTYVGFDEFDTVKTKQAIKCYQKAIGRLRGNDTPQLYIVTTPEGFKATYKIFVEDKKDSQEILHAKTTDNHFLPPTYLKLLEEQYDPKLLKAYMNGEFVNLTSGSVYYSFDRAKYVLKKPKIVMNGFPINICIDFNVYPFSLSWNQVLADDNVIFLGEWVSKSHSNTEEACDALIAALPKDADLVIYGDASGRNGSTSSNVTNYQIIDLKLKAYFNSVNYQVPTSNPAVKDRINCVNTKLSKNHVAFNPSCEKLIQDFEQVVWNEKGTELDKADILRTHSSDGAGYFFATRYPIQNMRIKHKTRSI